MIRTVVCVLLFVCGGIAQPYYFWTKAASHKMGRTQYKVFRLDLTSGKRETFLKDGFDDIIYDATQTWIVNGEGRFNKIINIASRKPLFYIEYSEQILYSSKTNKIFLFGTDGKTLNIINIVKEEVVKTDTLPGRPNNELSAFFSADKKTLYFTIHVENALRFNTFKDKLVYYSAGRNRIYKEEKLSKYGHPGVDGYILSKGQNGVGIVESYFYKEAKGCYYRLCDFDKGTCSQFIWVKGYSEAYIAHNGDLLIIAGKKEIALWDKTYKEYYTGEISIYEVKSTQLLKKIKVPVFNNCLHFDNYPDMLYCVKSPDKNFSYRKISIDSVLSAK
jgi:hypothetical protein